jgi:TRAP-type uncharacterized transport system fused permease subunit
MRTGIKATQIAIAGFVVPYMAVYDPALMMQGDAGWLAVLYVVFKAVLAICLWGAAAIGHFRTPLGWIERGLAVVAAALLVVALPVTDKSGFALAAALIAWNLWRVRRAGRLAQT